MLPKTRTIEKKMIQSLFTFFADGANLTISGCSPGYTSIQTKTTHKSDLHMETTDMVRVITTELTKIFEEAQVLSKTWQSQS